MMRSTDVSNSGCAVNQILYPKPGFDYEKDLAPVAMLAESNMMVVASPTFAANNLQEMLELARRKPGAVSMSVSVLGSPNHMGAELLAAMGKVELNFIVYKGISAALPDLMSGTVDISIGALSSVLPQVKAGRLKALAVTRASRRHPLQALFYQCAIGAPATGERKVASCFCLSEPM
jgi:tripartite-type tricarboxylate transporter receptor subunit TctC